MATSERWYYFRRLWSVPRLAAGLQRGVIDATGFEARQGLQPANGRSPVVAMWARSSARLCAARISAARKSLSLSAPRSVAWPALPGVPRIAGATGSRPLAHAPHVGVHGRLCESRL